MEVKKSWPNLMPTPTSTSRNAEGSQTKLQDNHHLGQDFKLEPCKYKTGVLHPDQLNQAIIMLTM
jgi:hypothetical protein